MMENKKLYNAIIGLIALMVCLSNSLQANDLIIRNENEGVIFNILENGSIRSNLSIKTNATTVSSDDEDLIVRTTDNASENQMLFTSSVIGIKGRKVIYEGDDNKIDDGLYFINSEAETGKKVRAAVTENEGNLVSRGNFEYKVLSLGKDPDVPERTNHPVLFVHGINSNAASTFHVSSFGLYLYPFDKITCTPEIEFINKGGKFPIKTAKVNAKLKLNVHTSGGMAFYHETKVELTNFIISEDLRPEDITVDVKCYKKINYLIKYEIYLRDLKFSEGLVIFDIQKVLQTLLADKTQRLSLAFAWSDLIVSKC